MNGTNARLIFSHAMSPLHAGTGQGVGVIDLPIARERATSIPFLPGSSLKGSLRDLCEDADLRVRVFGPESTSAEDHAGSAQFSDLRLLLLPVRSLVGTFAWVTSPYILSRLRRDAKDAGAGGVPGEVPAVPDISVAALTDDSQLEVAGGAGQVYLEDLDLKSARNAVAGEWAGWVSSHVFPDEPEWRRMMSARFCVVHDDLMSFLLDTATEITARVRLMDDTKAVQKGGLWYEESLPAESILYGLVLATHVKATPEEVFKTVVEASSRPVQLGGKATVGRGLCRLHLANGKEQN
jgi:CRISPR-associated protein Cmr4